MRNTDIETETKLHRESSTSYSLIVYSQTPGAEKKIDPTKCQDNCGRKVSYIGTLWMHSQRLAYCGDLDGLAFYRAVRGDEKLKFERFDALMFYKSTSFPLAMFLCTKIR